MIQVLMGISTPLNERKETKYSSIGSQSCVQLHPYGAICLCPSYQLAFPKSGFIEWGQPCLQRVQSSAIWLQGQGTVHVHLLLTLHLYNRYETILQQTTLVLHMVLLLQLSFLQAQNSVCAYPALLHFDNANLFSTKF